MKSLLPKTSRPETVQIKVQVGKEIKTISVLKDPKQSKLKNQMVNSQVTSTQSSSKK